MDHKYTVTYDDIMLIPMSKEDNEEYRLLRNLPEIRCWFEHNSVISAEEQTNWYMNYLKSPNEVMFSAYSIGGGLLGCNSLYQIDNINKTAEYGRIIVDKQFSGKNYGYKMTKAALKIAGEQLDLDSVYLTVYKENISAIKIYQRVGFLKTGESVDSEGRCMLDMEIQLKLHLSPRLVKKNT